MNEVGQMKVKQQPYFLCSWKVGARHRGLSLLIHGAIQLLMTGAIAWLQLQQLLSVLLQLL